MQNTDILVKILKQNADVFGNYICDSFNNYVNEGVTPTILENANITLAFKKRFRDFKDNY